MDAYHQPSPYMRPPSGPPPPADPYRPYYQHPARPPVPPPTQPGGPTWYSNQFHNPHSPSPPPPPPPQWGPPSAYPPFATQSHQPPFNVGANGNSQFPPPTGPPPYTQPNQEWGNPNWGYQQGHTSQANSNVEDWAVKAREWASANGDQHSQSAPNPPSGQVFQPSHGYQDVHQQHPNHGYQQFPVPPTTQPERYPNYAAGNESFPGLPHQENLPISSVIHQQEVPYSYSSVAGKDESSNSKQHEVQISVPDGGGPVHTEQQMQYAYGDQTAAPPNNCSDQPSQFATRATRESSDYASLHNAYPPHPPTEVVYPPIPSSVSSMPQHDSSMAMPPVSGHTMPPFGRFPPPNLQPVGSPYAFGTKPPLHPVAGFMDDSYASSTVAPKKASVPNWLKEELLKNKASLGRPSSGSFEERESMDEDVVYKPPARFDQRDNKRFSPSKSSDEEEEEDEDEMDAARTTAINMEIKRILTEVLLKVTDELFDEIATKVINEDEAIRKDDSIQNNHKSSSSLHSIADPVQKASVKLVSVERSNKEAGAGSPADVLGLASYASDDDDDTVAASNADNGGSDGVESLGMGSRNNVHQQPGTEKLPEPKAMVNMRLDPDVEVRDMSPNNNNSGLDQILASRRNDGEGGRNKILDISASSGLDDDTLESRTNHHDRTDSDKDGILSEPHMKNFGLKSDCNLLQDSNKSSRKNLSDDVSRDRSRTDEMKIRKEKAEIPNGSKDRTKQKELMSAEKVEGLEPNKKSTDLHVKRSRDTERPHRTNSKEDRSKKREKEKEEKGARHRQAEDSSKEKRRRSPTSYGSSDDATRKYRSRRRNISPSPVRSRRKRSSPSSDESSDDSRRKSSSRRRNRSPSPERSRRRHVSSRSPHSKRSQQKNTLYSSHDKSRSMRSRSRSPHRRHRA